MELIKKYLPYIICIGLLMALLNTCSESAAIKIGGENNILEKVYQRKIDDLKSDKIKADKVVDSLNLDNKKKNEKISIFRQENDALNKKISVLVFSRQKEIKNYTYKEAAEFFGKTYKAPKSVSFDNKGVTVTDSLPNLIIQDIKDIYYLSEELKLTKGVVFNLEKEGDQLNGIIKNKDLEIKSIVELSSEKDSVISSSNDLIQGQKKEIGKIKTARWIERVLIVGGVVGGLILIK